MWVDYEPWPKNIFVFKVNDADIYSLVKEEVDYDPTKTESLKVNLSINNRNTINGNIAWIIDEVSDKLESALGMECLNSL